MKENLKILVIDDTEFLREAIRRFLEEYGCNVVTCSKGILGIKEAVEFKPDLIILELILPSFSGIDVIKSLGTLEVTSKIPIIAMTAHKTHEYVSEALALGIKKILIKPLNKQTVVSAILQVLGITKIEGGGFAAVNVPQKSSDDIHIPSVEIKITQLKTFLKQIDYKIVEITSAFNVKNERMLRSALSDLRKLGAGIGYHRLIMLCEYMETKITEDMKEGQWKELSEYAQKLKIQLENIKTENAEKDK